jgi:ligand-binding SRPBCC domain-containing protein
MKQLLTRQVVPISLDEAWTFFSSPRNLSKITPDYMNFRITSDVPDVMYEGLIITYNVSPVLGISVKWVTEISHAKSKTMFVDNQLVGPYALWHHQHHFKEVEGGVEMTDIVTYKMPYGVLGRLLELLVVNKKVKAIFSYRTKKIEELFGIGSAVVPK